MKAKFYHLYALLSAVAAVIYLLVSVPATTWGMFRFVAPELTISQHDYRMHQSNAFFCEQQRHLCHPNERHPKEKTSTLPLPDKQTITAHREDSWKVALQGERRSGLRDIINMGLGSVFALFVFFTHRRMLKPSDNTGQVSD